jgi:hypothetical protein
MTSLRVVTDRAELTGLVPSLVDIHPAVLNAAPGDREDVRARREGFYYAALDTHSENTRMSAAVAETADGQVVGYAFGGLYNGSESLWRDDKGGELLVPEGDRRRAISRATPRRGRISRSPTSKTSTSIPIIAVKALAPA